MQASKFQIECTCPSGKWIVKITCPNVPFTCLKYIKPTQLMWKSEIRSRPSDKSCRYSTCPSVIFTHLRWSDKWNFEPCSEILIEIHTFSFKKIYFNISSFVSEMVAILSWCVKTRFVPPTDQKYADSSTYWQFIYKHPPSEFHMPQERSIKIKC